VVFTAEIFMSPQGFVARALELGIVSKPARTQRGALKQLKETVRLHLTLAASAGKLKTTLKNAGYTGVHETPVHQNRFVPSVYDSQQVELSVPIRQAKGTRP
jgi:hypothetical protein